MSLYLDDGDVRLYHGDALTVLRGMPAESVQCVVTSPPFWSLRDYQADGQIGLEDSPEEWCERLLGVFREVRRVLRSDGCMWLEVGDTYTQGHGGSSTEGNYTMRKAAKGDYERTATGGDVSKRVTDGGDLGSRGGLRNVRAGIKPKDLVGAPWLLAFALRADGWYLRSDTIWARPNPMPESVTDRPTKSHSYVFLLTKSARYFYDADAIREPFSEYTGGSEFYVSRGREWESDKHLDNNDRNDGKTLDKFSREGRAGRNARSVWSIATEPTPFAHFATFPQALVERCIKAGTSEHGACGECGAPWRRITEQEAPPAAYTPGASPAFQTRRFASATGGYTPKITQLGWEPSCECLALCIALPVVPCTVLDPFMGSGTTALVARRLGRHATGIELNASYLEISAKRLQQLSLFAEPTTEGTK